MHDPGDRVVEQSEVVADHEQRPAERPHVLQQPVAFIRVEDDLIRSIDEYWGDDGPAPAWRLEKHIGTPIHE